MGACGLGAWLLYHRDTTIRSAMSETMRAVVLERPGEPLRVEELPRPRPLAGEVLVRVHGCGVCHTDLHVMKGEVAFPTPCVLGHEISGIVEEVGPA